MAPTTDLGAFRTALASVPPAEWGAVEAGLRPLLWALDGGAPADEEQRTEPVLAVLTAADVDRVALWLQKRRALDDETIRRGTATPLS